MDVQTEYDLTPIAGERLEELAKGLTEERIPRAARSRTATNLRYCLNSASLQFFQEGDPIPQKS